MAEDRETPAHLDPEAARVNLSRVKAAARRRLVHSTQLAQEVAMAAWAVSQETKASPPLTKASLVEVVAEEEEDSSHSRCSPAKVGGRR